MSSFCLSIDQICEATQGKILQKQDTFIYGVSTDSRSVQKGDLFIPLIGENFDAHKFIPDVALKEPGCILTAKPLTSKHNVTVIQVHDTLKALQDLGAYYRKLYPFQIIGITGSNGKTTTKFFAQTLLSQKYKTFASQKSFNNHFGVPLTLLSMPPDTEFGICEIGMNHAGEIATLTQLAQPDIALCTTVGRAHLMDFGKVDGIYNEKKDIYADSKPNSHRIFNLDNEWTRKMYQAYKNKRTLTFSQKDSSADIFLEIKHMSLKELTVAGSIQTVPGEATVPVFGLHNVINLMGAAGIALSAGLTPKEIWEFLPLCQTVWGRSQLVELQAGGTLIFDGYNANPDSVSALVENLAQLDSVGKKFFILGDMLEMGNQADDLHEEIGALVGTKNFDVVCFTGQFSAAFERGLKKTHKDLKNSYILNTYEDSLAIKIANMIQPDDVVVIKGSRGSKMERFVPHLKTKEAFQFN